MSNEKSAFKKVSGVEGLYLRTFQNGKRTYYARLHWRQGTNKKTTWISLRTDKISTAKLRIKDTLHRHRIQLSTPHSEDFRDLDFAQLLADLKKRIQNDPDLSKSAISAKEASLKRLLRAWPEMCRVKVRKVTRATLEEWVRKLKTLPLVKAPPGSKRPPRNYSGQCVNQSIGIIKEAMELAVDKGIIAYNIGEKLPRAKINSKKMLQLPSMADLEKLLMELRHPRNAPVVNAILNGAVEGKTQKERAANLGVPVTTLAYHERQMKHGGSIGNNKDTADFAEGLMVTGCRRAEAARLQWQDLNFERNQFQVYGTKSKTSQRIVPMIPPAKELFLRLRAERADEPDTALIFRRQEIQRAITAACERIGIPRLTHHDFRHFYITKCIESGVDFRTISEWVGHADGGILVAKTYGHLRDEHSQLSAAKVTFGRTQIGM